MERNFTNENFEPFLRQNADNLRMRASDKMWKNISRSLNKRRRRTGLLLGVFFLTTSLFTYYVITESGAIFPKGAPAAQKPAASHRQTHSPITHQRTSINAQDIPVQQPAATPDADLTNAPGITDNGGPSAPLAVNPASTDGATNRAGLEEPQVAYTARQGFSLNTIAPSLHVFDEARKQAVTKQEVPKPAVKSGELPIAEDAVASLKNLKKSKLEFQVFFTPTVSYRKLTENKSYLRTIQPGTLNPTLSPLADVNNLVTHKPDIGFELGVAAKYPISKKVNVRGGLQFNINRYDIKAFNSHTELATIALNNRNRFESHAAVSNYSNMTGYRSNWLQNFYFQASAPVGVEYKLKGNKDMHIGVAGAVQPTYILGDRAYLISSDYKNYAEVPWLIRRWNVATNVETFVSYSTGKLQWQVGPQVRYQLLSSFVSKYPVKENLFDFGLKVGVSLKKNQ
jgi:hypothetical protein